jgi:tetratricopeptide (TPR) repeat protein
LKAILLSRQGDLSGATDAAEKALKLAREGKNDLVLARTLTNIGNWYGDSGDIGRAIQLLTESVQVSERLGNRQGVAVGLGNLGYYYMQMGVFDLGCTTTQQAIDQAQSIGYFQFTIKARLNLGLNLVRLKDTGAALSQLSEAMQDPILKEDAFSQAICHAYTGLAYEQDGKLSDAILHFNEARRTLKKLGARPYTVDALAGQARCHLLADRFAEARQDAYEIWEYLDQNGSVGLEAPILAYLTCARAFEASGDPHAAQRALEKGIHDLQDRATNITVAEWRASFLENFQEHGEIIRLWQQSAAT